MIPLILSILSSTIIFIIFRMFKRFEVDTFQAIVFNYFTAAGIGFTLYGHTWNPEAWVQNSWMIYSLITSFLFISLFFLMGLSSQNNGVASTSIAVKMSMAISLTLFVFYYKESPSLLKITGILLAFISVILVSLPNKKNRSELDTKMDSISKQNDIKIKMVHSKHDTINVDTLEDLKKVRSLLK